MNESLWIVGKNDAFKRIFVSHEIAKAVVGAMGNRDAPLNASAFKPNDEVFLEHFIILERFGTRCEEVQVAHGSTTQ